MVYLISQVEVVDETLAGLYRELAALSIEKFSGKYIVRGADAVSLEGKSTGRKIVIVEFPSEQQLIKWYNSDEYSQALRYREKALVRDLFYVEGI